MRAVCFPRPPRAYECENNVLVLSSTRLLLGQRHQAAALDFVHAAGSSQHGLRDALSRGYRDLVFAGSFFELAGFDFIVDLLVRELAVGGDFGEGAGASGVRFFLDGLFFFC